MEEAIKNYLKDNLSLQTKIRTVDGYTICEVSLCLEDELISKVDITTDRPQRLSIRDMMVGGYNQDQYR